MKINANFGERVVLHTNQMPWVSSPMNGVDRRMLDRIGDEVARATSIVRYARGSAFPEHTHGGGEEFIVLEGTFQDEHGDYPAGSYVRNPPTTHHVPRADNGCVIFVKLWQFDPDDRNQFSLDLNSVELIDQGEGRSSTVLHHDARETVTLHMLRSKASLNVGHEGGAELLVLDGMVRLEQEQLEAQDWLRLPKGESVNLTAGNAGARLWIKTGHLNHVALPSVL